MTPAQLHDLRVRRVLAAHAGRRLRERVPQKLPKQKWPRAQRLRYYLDIKARLTRARHEIDASLARALPTLVGRSDGLRLDGAIDEFFSAIALRVSALFSDEQLTPGIRAIGRDVSDFNAEEIATQLRAATGVDFSFRDPALQTQLELFTSDNVRLVQNLNDSALSDLQGIVARGARTGASIDSIKEQISARFDIADTRAEFIARDQIGKFNGELTRIRQTSVGVEEYRWSTAHDEIVRPDHRRLDGTVNAWDDPPIVNRRTGDREHPGGDYSCRCASIPIVQPLLDALGAA